MLNNYLKIKNEMKAEFSADFAERNVKIGRLILPLVAVLELVLLIFSIEFRSFEETYDFLYLCCYIGLLGICIVYTIMIWAFQKKAKKFPKSIHFLTVIFVIVIMAWGMCVSWLDNVTKNYYSPMVLMTVYMAISGSVLLHPSEISIFFTFSFAIYYLVDYFLISGFFYSDRFLNLLIFVVIAILVSFVRFGATVKDFISDCEVAKKGEELLHANNKLKDLNDRLEKISITDRLTRLRNRWVFGDRLKDVYIKCLTNKKIMSVVMFDIDDFKLVNDKFGHSTGDKCLIEIAEILKAVIPPHDLFRYGGEEFVLIFKDKPEDVVYQIIEDIRKNVEKKPLTDLKLKITISGGQFSGLPDDTISADKFLINADRALYAAKAAGKNNIKIYHSGDKSMIL